MNILVVGGGGREHALVWKISQNPDVKSIFCIPGNAGISKHARCIPIDPMDSGSLLQFALEKNIDLVAVGPEAPLVNGLVDLFEAHNLNVFGPCKDGARLEGSKVFAKEFMVKNEIPTAGYRSFTDAREASDHIKNGPYESCVVKADGLAAGKGVIVASSKGEALQAVEKIMVDRVFGPAGNAVVIEERLEGEEVSILAFTDGDAVVPMVSSQDHKAAYDGDKGPNTGGMGAYSPAPIYTEEIHKVVQRDILEKTVSGLKEMGIKYKGVLYAGLMLTKEGPKVLEFNVRFGDPETQPVLFRMQTDLVEVMQSVCRGSLYRLSPKWDDRPSVCVVIASGGYPEKYEKGKVITGVDQDFGEDTVVFHAGTADKNGCIVSSGGRVLGVTTRAKTLQGAVSKAYQCIDGIYFEGMYYRKDIGQKALKKLV